MKALILQAFSKTPVDAMVLTERPEPQLAAGQVLVRMAAAALNPADLHIARGEMKMMSPVKPPFALGVDGAGIVASDGVRFRRGQRVMLYTGLVQCGTLAEVMAVPEAWLAPVPEGWSLEEAAAAPLALLVAIKVLERAGARAGDSILVQGAGGPVGAATVALAAAKGLTVHGSGAGVDEAYVRGLGATGYTDYRKGSVRDLGQRFDIALDSLGGKVFDDCAAVIKRGGRIVSLKTMTGTGDMDAQGMRIPWLLKLLMPLVFGKPKKAAERAGATLIGLASYQDGAALARAAEAAVAAQYRPRIDATLPFADHAAAFARLSANPRGKVVVRIRDAEAA
ncbi:MAG: zinc-binding dehydrogenase [Alphaproteobacteria bacterium]|nr:zinc-binding dehydrogenase [Alphaproteobacteria bacterium]